MVSSAVYRYFPSRDGLLTALIVDAYDSVGAAAEVAESAVRRGEFTGRWMAVARAVRRWALIHPHEWALIFGSPVPGYRAPADTVDPALRIPVLLLRILSDAAGAGRLTAEHDLPMPRSVRADMKALGDSMAPTLSQHDVARAVMTWSRLIGSISFELFGHLTGGVHDNDAYFEYQMRGVGRELGLAARAVGDGRRTPTAR
jgi:AcrR family transcriptional regulator